MVLLKLLFLSNTTITLHRRFIIVVKKNIITNREIYIDNCYITSNYTSHNFINYCYSNNKNQYIYNNDKYNHFYTHTYHCDHD